MDKAFVELCKIYCKQGNYYAAAIIAFTNAIVSKTKNDKILAEFAECNVEEDEEEWPASLEI